MTREDDERSLRRELRRIQRKKQERVRQLLLMTMFGCVFLIVAAAAIVLIRTVFGEKPADPKEVAVPDWVAADYLTPNPYSRPQKPLTEVKGIVVHYVANPCSTARENRNFFEGLKNQTGNEPDVKSVSSHFVIGLEGEVVQCIPIDEVAYASNHRNSDTISIECCHPDISGKFYDSTYESLVRLCAYFCHEFGLKPDAVIRHYDVVGKSCPKYFVVHPVEWEAFREDVKKAMKEQY